MMYKQSNYYNLDISLDELFYFNPEVKIDTNFRRSEDSKFIGTMVMYLKRPNSERRNIVIGIANDGFVNVGSSLRGDLDLPIIPLEEAINIMSVYLDLYTIGDELESLLLPIYFKRGNRIKPKVNISFSE